MIRAMLYLLSLLVPARLRAAWREEWLGELHAAHRAGAGRAFRMMLGAPFDALSSRWTTSRDGSGWRGPWRSDWLQSIRSLRRSPGHVLVVSLCLGVGIAVCTTTFSILNAYTNGELPGVTNRAGLARLHLSGGNSSMVDYEILREGSPSFAGIAAEGTGLFAVRLADHAPLNVSGAFVSGNYFHVLGTQPHLGRLLDPSDDRPDVPLAVAISHAFWTTRLGAPADIVGKAITIGGRPAVVTGVGPEGFRGLRGGEMNDGAGFAVYVPLTFARGWSGARSPEQRWLNVYGRLTVPMDSDRLTAELQPLARRIEATPPITLRNAYIAVTETWRTPNITTAETLLMYLLMLSAPFTVLAIGCANVANLQMVRASLRARELAMRASLGASRSQIVRLLTFEAVLLAVAAFATAGFGIWALLRVAALVIPMTVHVDTRVLFFSASLAVLVIGATGLLPGLISTRSGAAGQLRSGGRSIASGNSRLRRGLVVAQVALSFLLLLTAGFFIRGMVIAVGELPAHAPHTLVTRVGFSVLPKYGPAQRRDFVEAFDARMRDDSRVRAIGYTSSAQASGQAARVWRPGDADDVQRIAETFSVGGDFFEVTGRRLLRGRALTSADAAETTAVVLVNQAFVSEYALDEPVVGQPFRMALPGASAAPATVTIVGVVSGDPAAAINENPGVFLPLGTPSHYVTAWISADHAVQLTEDVRRTIANLDPELPALSVRTLEDLSLEGNDTLRMVARTAGGLGLVALLLAVSGLYSVIAFFVALRTSEFGIRLALGARSADIVRMVLGQALRLAGAGLAIGAVLGVPLLIGLNASFPFTERFDAAVILPPAIALALTALVAGWLPARRASSVQASDALRAD